MKKLILFLVSALTSLSAFAELDYDNAYWVVKDGKMTKNVSYVPYDDLGKKVPSEMFDTTVAGENVVVYKQLSRHYLDVRLKFNPDKPLNLAENYVMVFEYKIPDSHSEVNLIKEGNKPLWIIGLSETEASLDKINCTKSEAYSMVDAKWGVTGEWVNVTKYIFSHPSVTTLEGIIVSYAREYLEGDMSEFPYIKNLGFVPMKEGKPFYAESFDGIGLGEFYFETNDVSDIYPNGTNTDFEPKFIGGVNGVVTPEYASYCDDNAIPALAAFRDFRKLYERDQDGSGYIDDEQLHGLQVETNRDSIVFPGIQIPEKTEKFYSKMLIKKHKNEKNYWKDAEDFSSGDIPIMLLFNTGEYVDLAKDTIKPIWTVFESEVEVPAGATSFDLIYKPGLAGYLVDDVFFSAFSLGDVKYENIANDAFDFVAYFDEAGSLVVENADLVGVYNMNGAVATSNDKAVAVVVKNAEGKIASKLLIRK
ncbi:MAG: hypothetical protein MJZ00_03810 [Paludibacteraceae bacterium]|nr:hypothetical protein [Paludibacteraceae bacterium]